MNEPQTTGDNFPHHGMRTCRVSENGDDLRGPELMTRKEAALYLRVKEHTLAVWHSTGRYQIRMVKMGRRCLYRRVDLDAFIQTHMA